eukprot:CAMPEP_0114424272 /NCGR_PEP_ID=MMETSP0103-20121206/6605_1 /TAXON_ID=37642 ORGANISM="Paraphysomonas imperforata, Strain PA2" /NCGR_SAMPLE_ID=MMETSP0103 /ASSEMBLY_ACC=CAM_ASM_000201 /LENGTH=129 /DNA_ID=CAMNT_0001593013 /DNA_START=36 /DNA_END=425 /DNA_ORIENTATION=+
MTSFAIVLALCVLAVLTVGVEAGRNSEKTQAPQLTRAEEDVNDALADWCRNGFPTKTTNECICATHKGFFCEGDDCQSGYGMSFFPKACERCACKPSGEWGERKSALQANRKKGKKGKKGKKRADPSDD